MTSEEFKLDKGLTEFLSGLVVHPSFRKVLEAMDEMHPKNFRQVAKLQASDHSIELGRIYGYDEFLNNLKSLAVFSPKQAPLPEPTFAGPEVEKKKK